MRIDPVPQKKKEANNQQETLRKLAILFAFLITYFFLVKIIFL